MSWITRDGTAARIGAIAAGTPDFRLSPDGGRLAISRRAGRTVRYEVLRLDGMTTTLVADVTAAYTAVPVWFPDGRRLLVTQSTPAGDELWVYDVGGARPPSRLVRFPGLTYVSPHGFSPDGRFLTVTAYGKANADVLVVDVKAASSGVEPAFRTFVGTPTFDGFGTISPDGRLVAYVSEESGSIEIYVRRFPTGEDVMRVSAGGGSVPRWSADGRELYFTGVTSHDLLVSRVVAAEPLRFSAPRVVYRGGGFTGLTYTTSYDVAPDGRLLIRELPADPVTAREIVVVQHWFEELRRLTSPKP